ncbi:MAG: rhodanese [Pirellulales bacterium]|nr:rhodanese [Pirellulales bacterium]
MTDLPLEINCPDAHRLLAAGDAPLLVDCREPHEHAIVALPGARLMPMSKIADRLADLQGQPRARIIVYCHLGVRSRHVAQWLRQQGFPQTQSLTGGIDQWALEIDPTLPRY